MSTGNPSDKTLERTVVRAGVFLRALSRKEVFSAMLAINFSEEEYTTGWALYHAVTRIPEKPPQVNTPQKDESFEALQSLDRWDDENFPILYKALTRHDANVRDYLFPNGAEPQTGAASVAAIGRLLDKVDVLRSGTDAARASRRDNDLATLDKLAALGYSGQALDALKTLVKTVTSVAPQVEPAAVPAPESEEELRQKLEALYFWYDQWSTIAHKKSVPAKYLRLMGLGRAGRPKNTKDKDQTKPPTPNGAD